MDARFPVGSLLKSAGDTFDMIGQSYYLAKNKNRRARSLSSGPYQVGLNGAYLAVVHHYGARFICHWFVFLSNPYHY